MLFAASTFAEINFTDYAMKIDFTVAGDYSDASDFPVLVRLSENSPVGFSYSACAEDGSDIRFSDRHGTVAYPYEIDTWNASGESLVWVRLPSAAKGTSFVMCYGRAGQTSCSDGAAVWSDYVGVWHMGETYDATTAGSGLSRDSTANGLDATPTNGGSGDLTQMVSAEGVVGNARVNATSNTTKGNYLSVASYDSLGVSNTFTISGWFKATTINGYPRLWSRKTSYNSSNGWEIENANGVATKFSARGASSTAITLTTPTYQDTWLHIALVYNGTTLTAYANGEPCGSGTIAAATDNGLPLSFGNNSNGSERSFPGLYDEIRLSKGAKSAERVAAEYATMSDRAFLSAANAVPTSPDTPVIDSASVAWNGGTEVTVALAGGKGAASAVFTDIATGSSYTVPLAAEIDATAAAQTRTFQIAASDLPLGCIYTWTVVLSNATLGYSASFDDGSLYYSGAADATVRYVSSDGDAANDGMTIGTAMASIQAAIDSLGAYGGTVRLLDSASPYVLATTVSNGYPVAVVGYPVNGGDVVVSGNNSIRTFILDNAEAKLSNLTVRDGYAPNGQLGGLVWIKANGGIVEDCVLDHGRSTAVYNNSGGGVGMSAGRVSRCVIKNCEVANHNVYAHGSAIYASGGLVEDCLIRLNKCQNSGGAVYLAETATLLNCTVTENTGGNYADVHVSSANASVVNCAIFGNVATSDMTGHGHVWRERPERFFNCAADAEIEGGTNCIEAENGGFKNAAAGDFRITSASPCLDAGTDRATYGAVSTTDLAGNPRAVDTVDIGCYENQKNEPEVSIGAATGTFLMPCSVQISAAVAGLSGEVTYNWALTNATTGGAAILFENAGATLSAADLAAGVYNVALTVVSGGESYEAIPKAALFQVAPTDIYASAENPDAQFPFTTPETAAATIVVAVDAAVDGTRVHVLAGTFSSHPTVNLLKAVSVFGETGDPADATVLAKGGERAFYLNNPAASVANLTLSGSSQANGKTVCVEGSGGTVSNCVIQSTAYNTAWGACGMAYGVNALFTHCVFRGYCRVSTGDNPAGGVAIKLANTSRLANSIITNITTATDRGNGHVVAALGHSSVVNCTIAASVMPNPTSTGLSIDGTSAATNCAVYGVVATEPVYEYVDNLDGTITTNQVDTLHPAAPWSGTSANFVNCATDGDAAINETCLRIEEGSDLFTDYANSDYTPKMGGLLVNAGVEYEGLAATDLAGKPRKVGKAVDIGCYECQKTPGFFVLVR
ncbi:MAG: DUF2341 domain-containing protein [Kiritimatiellae bacterium]|nr:DUF2341 domain-containing protein [Kiritimatiellia bacterium]